MGFFRDSEAEVQAVIDELQTATTFTDEEMRKAHAKRAVAQSRRLRRGKMLAPQLDKLVEADNVDRAIKLMEAYKGARGFNVAPLAIGISLLAAPFFLFVMPRLGGAHSAAMDTANACDHALRALGEPIGDAAPFVGCGTSQSSGGTGFAQWTVPVGGPDGRGSYEYVAEKSHGTWHLVHGAIETDGRWISVVPCRGEVDESDARGLLRHGYSATGKAGEVRGAAPVKYGDPCTVTVDAVSEYPSEAPYNCKVRVACNNVTLYGVSDTTGYVFCSVEDGLPVEAHDSSGTADNSDPMLHMDLKAKTVEVSDDAPTEFGFTILLD